MDAIELKNELGKKTIMQLKNIIKEHGGTVGGGTKGDLVERAFSLLRKDKPKLYLVYPSDENEDAGPECKHIFTDKKMAQKYYVRVFVETWFKRNSKKKVSKYFEFDPFKEDLSDKEFKDILFTFNQDGYLYEVDFD